MIGRIIPIPHGIILIQWIPKIRRLSQTAAPKEAAAWRDAMDTMRVMGRLGPQPNLVIYNSALRLG